MLCIVPCRFTSGGCNYSDPANKSIARPSPFRSCQWITERAECFTAVSALGLDPQAAKLYGLAVREDTVRGCSFQPGNTPRRGLKIAFNPDTGTNTTCSKQQQCVCRCRPQVFVQTPEVCGGVPVGLTNRTTRSHIKYECDPPTLSLTLCASLVTRLRVPASW